MRLCPIAGIVVLALAVLPGCGEEGAATASKGAQAQFEQESASREDVGGGPGARCLDQVGRFVDGLELLREGLLAGLTYESYVAEVRELRDTYDAVPVGRLALGCLIAIGRPGEQALNEYIEAANTWGECLADASCDPSSIESELQRGWEQASEHLGTAHEGLPAAQRG